MSRYIDADALLKEWKIEFPKKRPVNGEPSEEFLEFMKKYGNHPYYFAILSLYLAEPADVVEVVHGEWIDTNPNEPLDPRVTCSVCGNTEVLFIGNYCPSCGADMR